MMIDNNLYNVQQIVNHLPLTDKIYLLEHLTLHISRIMSEASVPVTVCDLKAWDEFFSIGDALAISNLPVSETMTAAVSVMRR